MAALENFFEIFLKTKFCILTIVFLLSRPFKKLRNIYTFGGFLFCQILTAYFKKFNWFLIPFERYCCFELNNKKKDFTCDHFRKFTGV